MKYLRIKKKKEFSKILKSGKRAHAEHLTIVYLPDKARKMAVCVGKKYGKSVVRNRIKRLLREAYRAKAEPYPLRRSAHSQSFGGVFVFGIFQGDCPPFQKGKAR